MIDLSRRSNFNNAPDVEVPCNLDYIALVIDFINSSFINKTSVPPIFLMQSGEQVYPVLVPVNLLDSESGKLELIELMRLAVSAYNPESYCFISEAWVYTIGDCEDKSAAIQALDAFKKGEHTENIVKSEAVTFALTKVESDGSKVRWLGHSIISRNADNTISGFKPIRWMQADCKNKLEGNLFI